ncbi:MED14-domain-containing protein [Wallemia mellicola]|uniref:Mediator of RNA polymerase II transcription subunit 14 n=1 Tax=Wallemia mellicola TaxID=1708541 RepID=A0A4T0M3Z9_9BASI|nr:MED14-domain-containing protein [Wallemia mellicola]
MAANDSKIGGSQITPLDLIPDVKDSLVPFSIILERSIARIFNDLHILAETLPSINPSDRASNIVNFALNSRKQVIKLIVLLRWAKDPLAGSDKIQIARSINELLWRQNFIFQATVQGLQDVSLSFSNARVRNADIITALDVLQTGTYHGLPVGLRRAFKPEKPLSVTAVIAHLEQLNDVIRFRLRTKEIIPHSMKQIPYTIADGRVFFHVKNLFTCSVTLSGRSDDDIWFLLSVEFDIDSSVYTKKPKFGTRDEILAIANEELANKPPKTSALGDAPLVRLYNLLTNLSLNYKMEILHTQALNMARKTWKNKIDLTLSKDRRNLSIGYWLRPRQQPKPGQSPPPNQKTESGRLNISIATLSSEKQNPVESILNQIEIKSKLKATALADEIIEQCLQVDWTRNDKTEVEDAVLDLNTDNLSIERVVLQALVAHSVALLKRYKKSLCASSSWFNNATVHLQIPEVLGLGVSPTLHIQVFETQKLILSISPTTGRLIVRDPNESGTSAPARIKNLLDRMNEAGGISDNTPLLVEIVNRLRQSIAIEDIEQKCAYLQYKGTRRLKFAKGELNKLKLQARFWMFIHLPFANSSNNLFTMAIAIGESKVHVALIGIKEVNTELHVDYVGWLDTTKILAEETLTDHLLLDMNHIRILYAYSLARSNYIIIERQLKQRSVEFNFATTNTGSRLAGLIPHLTVHSNAFLRDHPSIANIFKPIAIVKVLDWWGASTSGCRIQAIFKPKGRSSILQKLKDKTSENVRYDYKSNVVEVTTTDNENTILEIIGQLTTFVKVTLIANQVSKDTRQFKLIESNLDNITLSYMDNYNVKLSWNSNKKMLYADFSGEGNPHKNVQEDMNRRLKSYVLDSGFFYRFTTLLLNTAKLIDTTKSLTKALILQRSSTHIRVKGMKEVVDIYLVNNRRVVIVDGTRALKNMIEPIIYSRLIHSEITSLDSTKKEILDKFAQQTKIIDSGVVLNNVDTGIKALPCFLLKLN